MTFSISCISPTYSGDRHQERGFSLLELLLVIGVLGILFLGLTRITQAWIDKESANSAGRHLSRVTSLVQRYVDARGTTLPSSLDVVADGAIATSEWADLYTALEQEGFLNGGTIRSPSGAEILITFLSDAPNNRYRAAIIAMDNYSNRRALQIARYSGMDSGTVAAMPNIAALNEARGAFGQWIIPLNELLPGGAAAFPCAANNTRGCVLSVVNYTLDDLCGSYLYRHTTACIDGNTMHTTLNMNDNEINNASLISTEDLYVDNLSNLGDMNVSGTANFAGPAMVSGGMTVNGGMTVTGDANFSNDVRMDGGGTLNVTHLNAHDIRTPSINTNSLNTQDMDVTGAVTAHDNVTVTGDVTVQSADPATPATIYASTVNASTINATGGQITTNVMNVQNTMTITGGMNITGTGGQRTLVVDRLIADDCVSINSIGETYGVCP